MQKRRFVGLMLTVVLLLPMIVSAPALADHTSAPSSVSIPGSFGNELGCAGDWDPACAATTLTAGVDEVWRGDFNVPAGAWAYKAAIDGSWDENYGVGGVPGGADIPLDLEAATDVTFYYSHATHWITDDVGSRIATAAGSFQSELGCPGDWDPGCLRSWLQDLDGDGVYTFATSALPEGDYEFKVAIDESWDENYGAGGVANGDNIPFSVGAGDTVTVSFDSAANLPTVSVDGGGLEPGDEELVREPVRHPFSDEVLYFTMPDRFDDGDTANNCGDYTGACPANDTEPNVLTHGYLPSDRGYYHGGDIAGLRSRLPYLEALGVNAVWVAPIFENRPVQPDSGNLYGHSSGYHGYWITDFHNVDPHLGTNAEFAALVDDAHARGIDVFMDIVTNHTADVVQLEGNAGYRNKTNFPYLDVDDQPFDDSAYAYSGQDDYDFPEVDATSFPYVPSVPPGDETLKNPDWLNDPLLYHNRGDSSFSGENSLYGDFFGLDDLWTERKEVVDGMIDIYSFWIEEFGVDGFRIDTTKHVNLEFWQKFGPDILSAAEAEGIADFFAFGEVFDQTFGPPFLSHFSTQGDLQGTIDFAFQIAARGFASAGGASDDLASFFAADDWYTDTDSNAYAMPTFVGNHDMGRIGHFLQVDQPGAGDAELLARSKLAQALMFFTRGQPVIYYGDEQGFTGDGGDKLARQDMFANTVPDYADDDLIGTDATTSDDNFDQTHPIFQALADNASAYHAHPALRTGAQIHRLSSSGPGVYAFSRMDRDEQIEYVVAFNNAETAGDAAVPTFHGEGVTFDLVIAEGGGAATAITQADGTLPVSVAPLGFVVYRATTTIPARDTAPGISITGPADGATVILGVTDMDGHDVVDRIEVAAQLDTDDYAEVTFAAAVDGGDYEPIGTDDNAPYRVFYDATGLADGATVAFKAIVVDASGNLNADKVEGIMPVIEEQPPPPAGGEAAYGVIHYLRTDGDYGDHTTGDFNDFWGLHLFGDIDETIEWTAPKPFLGEDEYGRFAWVDLAAGATEVGVIVHRGDTKDGTQDDRFFNPSVNPEIWLKQDDAAVYTSQADAQGYVTVRYHRPDGDYGVGTADYWGLHLWGDAIDPSEGTAWDAPKPPDGVDDFGAFWQIAIQDATLPVNFIVHTPSGDDTSPGGNREPGGDRSFVPTEEPTVWLVEQDETVHGTEGSALDTTTIHYHRPDGDYGDYTSDDFNDFWGMHTWDGSLSPTEWPQPLKPADFDVFGPVFEVPLVDGAPQLAYIIHRGDAKDPGPDQFLDFEEWGHEVWQLSGEGPDPDTPHYVLPVVSGPASAGNLDAQRAHWVSTDTIVWPDATDPTATYALYHSPDGSLELTPDGVGGGASLPLQPGDPFPDGIDGWLHLAGMPTFTIATTDLIQIPDILKGQIAVASSKDGIRIDATGVQIPGVLDDLYADGGPMGVTWDDDIPVLSVWAPTALDVDLLVFADAAPGTAPTRIDMTLDDTGGTWIATGEPGWKGQYYLYEVDVYVPATGRVETNVVTDPYSISLSMNSARTQIVDLDDTELAPDGWADLQKPGLDAAEDISVYELHVRDFSAGATDVPEDYRGTYKAFTVDSAGTDHLEALAESGLTHLHLLPVFDIATINEDKGAWQTPDPDVLSTYPPDSDQQQAAVAATRDLDGFNWGYDPWHYTTPEGSYSTDPDGTTRIVEFREMVGAIDEMGLRVVMDVVYNHTNSAGQAERSVLDRIVPGYYQRLDANGTVANSTCCANTATEHAMMEKLMVDSVVTWAKQYKIDGFRFDLMGHHSLANMQAVRAALDELTPAADGVDGTGIYLYGEGWNFGEVADDARFVQATQGNVSGTGIGTFNDRLRDAVRGGGPFDDGAALVLNQGYVNGVWYDPNELVVDQAVPEQQQLDELLLSADQIRIGLAGNLADYSFVDRTGATVTGSEIDYNGSPAGYTDDPQENIVYVSAHDNQTLFDIGQYHNPLSTSLGDRVRSQNLGISVTALAQGVPFLHAGVDMLRSKSMDRDSYNSGDWFNQLDFTYASNNWGVGLPVADVNEGNWPLIAERLSDPDLAPDRAEIEATAAHTREMLEVRASSDLFRLETGADVTDRLVFHNTGPGQIPGLIAMSISDTVGADLDPDNDGVWALVNPTDDEVTFTDGGLTGADIALHPVLAGSDDPIVRTAAFDSATGSFMVPARTTAVFVDPEPDETAPEVTAEIVPYRVMVPGVGRGIYQVLFTCSDDRDASPDVAADLNGAPVEDGQLVTLIPSGADQWRVVNGTLRVWGTDFTLTVACTDDAGNTATATAEMSLRHNNPL